MDNNLRNRYIKKSGIMGMILNIILFLMKLIIGVTINSVAVISDAFNNLADSLSSVVTLIGSYISGKPADDDHPFGHGRFEYISSLVVSFLIVFTGLTLLKASVEKILKPEEIKFSIITTIILILSILIKVFIYFYNDRIGKKIDSLVLESVAKDALSDIVSTIGIIISIFIYKFWNLNLDGYIGVLVSVFILKSGYDIAKESIDIILGQAPSEDLIIKIEEILLNGTYVRGVHDLELHEYGRGNIYGSVHLEFPCHLIFRDVHAVADSLEKKILNECNVNLTIHMDPINCSGRLNKWLQKYIKLMI